MVKYPQVNVTITDKDAYSSRIILKTASALARHQVPSWARLEFLETALSTNSAQELKNLCKEYVNLRFSLKDIVF